MSLNWRTLSKGRRHRHVQIGKGRATFKLGIGKVQPDQFLVTNERYGTSLIITAESPKDAKLKAVKEYGKEYLGTFNEKQLMEELSAKRIGNKGGKLPKIHETDRYIRVRIINPDRFIEGSFRTHDVGRKGHTKRIAGRLQSTGKWATQAWLFDKKQLPKDPKMQETYLKALGIPYARLESEIRSQT